MQNNSKILSNQKLYPALRIDLPLHANSFKENSSIW